MGKFLMESYIGFEVDFERVKNAHVVSLDQLINRNLKSLASIKIVKICYYFEFTAQCIFGC